MASGNPHRKRGRDKRNRCLERMRIVSPEKLATLDAEDKTERERGLPWEELLNEIGEEAA